MSNSPQLIAASTVAGLLETATIGSRVLCVSPNDMDGAALQRIFDRAGSGWTLIARSTIPSAQALREMQPAIVICQVDDLLPGMWRDLLEHISFLPDPPLLILASRLADERLWAEALNLGCYDVLAKPFDAVEVIRIIGLALQHWQDRKNLG